MATVVGSMTGYTLQIVRNWRDIMPNGPFILESFMTDQRQAAAAKLYSLVFCGSN